MTTEQIITMITNAGLDYHDFKCEAAANRYNQGVRLWGQDNAWEQIAEMARTQCSDADYATAWTLAGLPVPEAEAA